MDAVYDSSILKPLFVRCSKARGEHPVAPIQLTAMPARTQTSPGNGHERPQPWKRASGYAGPRSVAETVMSTLRTAETYAGRSVLEKAMESLPSERFAKQIEGIGAVGRFAEQLQAIGNVGRVAKQIEELRRISDVGLGKGLAGHLSGDYGIAKWASAGVAPASLRASRGR